MVLNENYQIKLLIQAILKCLSKERLINLTFIVIDLSPFKFGTSALGTVTLRE